MGIEIEVDSLEDMCALMCDNVIPKRRSNDKRDRMQELRGMDEGETRAMSPKSRSTGKQNKLPHDDDRTLGEKRSVAAIRLCRADSKGIRG